MPFSADHRASGSGTPTIISVARILPVLCCRPAETSTLESRRSRDGCPLHRISHLLRRSEHTALSTQPSGLGFVSA